MSDALASTDNVDMRGWAWPSNAAVSHYFVERRSLCGQWAWPHDTGLSDEPPTKACVRCSRKKEAARAD